MSTVEHQPSQAGPPEEDFDIETFLHVSVAQGISDIHLRVGTPPMVRKDGLIVKTKLPEITPDRMQRISKLIVPRGMQHLMDTRYDLDFSIDMKGLARFRANMFHDLGNIGFVLRVIPLNIPSIESLSLPPVLKDFTKLNKGLVLVTGPTGSGKSTTLASMLDHININQQRHIIALEDPIEFMHSNKKCVFTQRQLGMDTDNFPNGLKYALRQDPDIILIGEMRDRETISSALKAAETGHLVFSTLHTTDAVQTINRIINAFEPYEREPVRLQIAATLQGTVAQKLVKRAEGKGRVPATEVLVVTPAVRDYIARDEIDNIYQLLSTGDFDGMMSMNMSLYKLVKNNLISPDEALEASNSSNELQQMLRGAFHGSFSNTESR
ncbi:MAG: type IV pilus twitching motility protein PilT [Vampirovibrionia bacterium]